MASDEVSPRLKEFADDVTMTSLEYFSKATNVDELIEGVDVLITLAAVSVQKCAGCWTRAQVEEALGARLRMAVRCAFDGDVAKVQ